jgi:hypothetical protein
MKKKILKYDTRIWNILAKMVLIQLIGIRLKAVLQTPDLRHFREPDQYESEKFDQNPHPS